MKVAVTGSTGFLGTALVANLLADGHEVLRLVRRPPRAADEIRWDPRAADAGLGDPGLGDPGLSDPGPLRGIDACVHLAGAGVASRRWTARYKAEVKASRVVGTRALAGVLAKLTPPPAVLLCASAIGWYGPHGDEELTEESPPANDFMANICVEWERHAHEAEKAGVRDGQWGWGADFLDYDNDGRLDIFAENGFVTGEMNDDSR